MSYDFDWDGLRRDVAATQHAAAAEEAALSATRARLLSTPSVPQLRRRSRRVVWSSLLAAAATVALVLAFWTLRRAQPLTFVAGDPRVAVSVGGWVTPRDNAPLPLRFSDGTTASLSPATRARVVRTTSHGADLALEQGALSVHVVHQVGTEWRVAAGPFTVLVTGTKFDVAWDPDKEFTLALHEGSVRVLGPTLGKEGRVLRSGERLQVASAEAAARSEASRAAAVAELSATNEAANPTKPEAPSARPRLSGTWKELARTRHYAAALAAAEADGFDNICAGAAAADLMLLGNAARFAGSTARAEQAFRSVRGRFAATPEASLSALLLGRIAYDQRGNLRDAERWFRAYLHEAPVGNLAREAEGRLLEAQRGLGETAAARDTARAYLAKYPSGSHASLARDTLKP